MKDTIHQFFVKNGKKTPWKAPISGKIERRKDSCRDRAGNKSEERTG